MPQRRGVVAPPGFDQPAEQDRHIDDRGERRPGERRGIAQRPHRPGQGQRDAGVALAGDRGVAAPAEPALLRPEGHEREGEQDQGEHGGPPLVVLGADDGKEDLGREHVEVPAQHQRIAEVGEALDEAQEEGVGEARAHQRQGDGGEGGPGIRAQGLRRLLERGADTLDHADQDQERDRRERQHLREPQAGQAVDPAPGLEAREAGPELGHRARAPEQQDDREADHEGRGDDRQDRQHAQEPLRPEAGTGDDQRKGQAEQRRAGPGQHREQQRIPGDAAPRTGREAAEAPDPRIHELGEEQGGCESPLVVLERAEEHAERRVEDEGPDQGDHRARCCRQRTRRPWRARAPPSPGSGRTGTPRR